MTRTESEEEELYLRLETRERVQTNDANSNRTELYPVVAEEGVGEEEREHWDALSMEMDLPNGLLDPVPSLGNGGS